MTGSDRRRAGEDSDHTPGVTAVYQRVALVGCGRRFATSVAPTLWVSGARVVLAADPDVQARLRVASIAPHSDDLTLAASLTPQQLTSSRADAVIISSPSGLHYEHCAMALSCGLPTFVEKPLACTVPDARVLHASSGGLLAASEQRTHREDLRYVRSLIKSGTLGEIVELRYEDSITPAPHFARSWRNDPRLAGGGILLDLGYHTVGSVQWLLDVSSTAMAVTHASLTTSTLRVEDAAKITCMAGETRVSLDIRLVEASPREVLVAEGTQGVLRLERLRSGPAAARVSLSLNGAGTRHRSLPLDGRTDSESLLDFLCGRAEPSWLARHVDALEFLEQAYEHSGQQKDSERCD
jgi:predicted dehydrogenase